MLSARSWRVARRYVLPPLVLGAGVAPVRPRMALLPLAASAGAALFFRDPERPLDPSPDAVYAPADGVVMSVDRAPDAWLGGREALRIAIFLSLHDVHVNRSPIAGEIRALESRPGRLLPAFLNAASRANRQDRILISGERSDAVVTQTAGIAARRITRWVELGERVSAGDRLGLIHFGSRTDVLLPADAVEPLVRRGDRVRAGCSEVARYAASAPVPARASAEAQPA
jgi:phosphatidylserine decarboxylase